MFAGLEIDVVQTDTEPPYNLERAGRLEQCATHLCPIAHDQGARVSDGRRKIVRMVYQIRVIKYVEFVGQAIHCDLVHEFGNHDISHGCPPAQMNYE